MSQVEALLERLVEQNDEIIQRLSSIGDGVEDIRHELDWTNNGSGIAQIQQLLEQIETCLTNIENNTAG